MADLFLNLSVNALPFGPAYGGSEALSPGMEELGADSLGAEGLPMAAYGLASGADQYASSGNAAFHLPAGLPGTTLFSMHPPASGVSVAAPEGVSSVPGTRPRLDLAPYRDLLSRGARTAEDIALYDRLFSELEPADGMRLSRATADIPHVFEPALAGVLGYAKITFARSVDRVFGGAAAKIALLVSPERGATLFTLKHERVHAAPYLQLPYEYTVPLIPMIPGRYARLSEIYHATLAGRIWDEAMAFSSEIRLEQAFEAATGESLYSFAAHAAEKEYLDRIRPHFQKGGMHGVYGWVRSTPAYLPYKIGALYFAILVKQGLTEFPDWESVLNDIGVTSHGIDQEKLREFHDLLLQPLLKSHAFDIGLIVAGMTENEKARFGRALEYIAGSMTAEQRSAFLRDDFDAIVPILGILFGDTFDEETDVAQAPATDPANSLIPRSVPMRNEFPSELEGRPAVVADKIEIAGKYVEFLYKTDNASAKAVTEQIDSYLRYAERCDPESAARVYARIMELGPPPQNENGYEEMEDRDFRIEFPVKLGASLIRSGYLEEGGRYIADAVTYVKNMPEDGFTSLIWMFDGLLEANQIGLLETIVDRALELSQSDLAALSSEIDEAERKGSAAEKGYWKHHQHLIYYLVQKFSSLEGPELRERIPHRTIEKVWNVVDQEWSLLRRGMAVNFKAYQKADPREKYSEIEKCKKNEKGTLSELLHLIFRSPLFFEHGLLLLTDYPDCRERLELFKYAEELLPKDFSDGGREQFVRDWLALLNTNRWYFSDYFYWSEADIFANHYAALVGVLLAGKATDLKDRGRQLVMELFRPANPGHENAFAAIIRARALVSNSGHFSLPERMALSREAFLTLSDFASRGRMPNNEVTCEIARAIWQIAILAAENGDRELVEEIAHKWDVGIRERLEQGLDLDLSSPWLSRRDPNEYLKNALADILPLFAPLVQGIGRADVEGLQRLAERLEHDVRIDRGFFSIRSIVKAAGLLGGPGVRALSRLDPHALDAVIERFSRAAIDCYVHSIGEDQFLTEQFAPLVKMIEELSLPAQKRDELFAYLIEVATPESGVIANWNLSCAGPVYQVFKTLEFLIGNREMPRAEAILINRLAKAVSNLRFHREDPRSKGAFKGLDWLFDRIADAHFLDPAARERLAGLRPGDPTFADALGHLYSYAKTVQASVDPQTIRNRYRAAVQSNDVAALLRMVPALMALQKSELNVALNEILNNVGRHDIFFERNRALNFTLTKTLYDDWQIACGEGDKALEQVLFRLWIHADDANELEVKLPLLMRGVSNQALSLEERRAIFLELSKNRMVSRYAQQQWDLLAKNGDSSREDIFYRMFIPVIRTELFAKEYKFQGDKLLALAMELPLPDACRFAGRYERMRDLPSHSADIKNGFDRILCAFALLDRRFHLGEIYLALALRAEGVTDSSFSEMWNKGYRDDTAREAQRVTYEYVEFILKNRLRPLIPSFPRLEKWTPWQTSDLLRLINDEPVTPKDLEEAAASFDSTLKLLERMHDQVQSSQFEMPEIFSRREPLTQFLLSRFFMQQDLGEQQDLLRAMKDVPEERALAIFFEKAALEKVGQFLSFWPEVPANVQAELKYLQDDVAPSDFEEVRQTMRKGLGNSEGASFLIDHLEPKPLGSGSIGECYSSQLPDGRRVVVKVITPTKKARFLAALARIEEVHRLLELYDGRIEGAAEGARVMKMFIDMVRKELDLRVEAASARAMSESGDRPEGMIIPEYIDQLTQESVSVQDFVPGVKITQIADPKLRQNALEMLQGYLLNQVLQEGCYHSDMQPGNILIDPASGTAALIDFGQTGELTPEERGNVQLMINAFLEEDPARRSEVIAEVLERMSGNVPSSYSRGALALDIRETLEHRAIDPANLSETIMHLFRASNRHGLVTKLAYLQLLKGLATFEATMKDAVRSQSLP